MLSKISKNVEALFRVVIILEPPWHSYIAMHSGCNLRTVCVATIICIYKMLKIKPDEW